jgi:hypothetical protein
MRERAAHAPQLFQDFFERLCDCVVIWLATASSSPRIVLISFSKRFLSTVSSAAVSSNCQPARAYWRRKSRNSSRRDSFAGLGSGDISQAVAPRLPAFNQVFNLKRASNLAPGRSCTTPGSVSPKDPAGTARLSSRHASPSGLREAPWHRRPPRLSGKRPYLKTSVQRSSPKCLRRHCLRLPLDAHCSSRCHSRIVFLTK